MGSSKLMVTSLSCAELGTAQPQLVFCYFFFFFFFPERVIEELNISQLFLWLALSKAANGVPQLVTTQTGIPSPEAFVSLPENHSRKSTEKH